MTSRNPWKTVLAWVLIMAVAGYFASTLGDNLTTEVRILTNPESQRGADLIEERFGAAALDETVVITSETLTVDDPAFRAVVDSTTAALRAMPTFVDPATVFNYYELSADPASAQAAAGLVAEDRRSTLIPVTTLFTELPAAADAHTFLDGISAGATADVDVYPVGAVSLDETFTRISEEDLIRGETIGILAALVILLVVLGALVASGLPLLLGVVSIFVSIGLSAIVARAFELSFFVTNMISMIGLAVGIDYALFIVERYREERRHGRPKLEAIDIAGSTASKAVLFSGLTVVFALAGLLIIPSTIFRSLGIGAVLVVLVAVAAMLTLIPALLSLLGDKIDWPRKRNYDDPAHIQAQIERDAQTIHGGFWGSITKAVMARPVVALVLSAGLLIALSLPYFSLKTGFNGAETLPPSDVRSGFDVLARDFQAGRFEPIKIVVDGAKATAQPGLDRLGAAFAADPATFAAADAAVWNAAGDTSVVNLYLSTETNSQATRDTIASLRETIVPAAFEGTGATTYVSGVPSGNVDFFALVQDYTPIVFIFVLTLSFILLTLVFRSVVVPAKAIVMNLLSVGAAYGLLVLVFQEGWATGLFGFQQVATIEAWLPIFLFCVLFGLSMDYHVFLLSRVREHYDLTGNNAESVAVGLQSTAKIITGAALIMVAVFGGFASGRLVMFQQMGFGLGAAVLIDATIVRSILVPSAMALLGDRNWYMPSWLRWLPDLRVEGAPRPKHAGTGAGINPPFAGEPAGD